MLKTLYTKTIGGKHGWLWCFFLMFLLMGLCNLHYPLSGQALTMGDGPGSIYFPEWFSQQYTSGQLPLWSSESAGGIPVSSHMLGAFFLIPLLFAQLPLTWFIWLNYVFFVSFGACFFARYLEELGVNRKLSVAMGFVLLFCCHFGGLRKSHITIIECISLYPLIFFAFQRFLNTQKRSAVVLAGLGCGTMLLVTTPSVQYAMYLMLGLFVYVLVGCVCRRMKAKDIVLNVFLFLGITVAAGAVQVLPGYLLMQRYSALCTTPNYPYAAFVSYSIHPVKLLIAFFPNLFTDVYQAFGAYHSSELDIEIFLGTVAAATIVFGLLRYRKDRRIWLPALISFFAFLYAANGNIPYLSKILYKIPLLNSVRCPSRCLFLFVFLQYTILGVTLSRICKEKAELAAYRKFLASYTVVLGLGLVLAYTTPIRTLMERTGQINMDAFSVALHGLGPVVLLQIILFFCNAVTQRFSDNGRVPAICLAVALIISCIAETAPYFFVPTAGTVPSASSSLQQIIQANDNGKTITTYTTVDVGAPSETFAANIQMHTGVPSLNTYLTYNNPYLCKLLWLGAAPNVPYWNLSGLQTGYGTLRALLQNNEILSALGVKYIEDQTGMLAQNIPILNSSTEEAPLLTVDELLLPVCTAEYQCIPYPMQLERGTTYWISFDVETEAVPEVFYLDFYGTDYDNSEQTATFLPATGAHHYSGFIFSGDAELPTDAMLRIVTINKTAPLAIRNLTVSRIAANTTVYQPMNDEAGNLYYRNTRAKEILFTVDELQQMENLDDIEICPNNYRFTSVAYAEDVETTNLSNVTTTFSDVTWLTNHTLQATAVSNGRNFVVFSQCYDPSWRVYVDGQRVENHRVDLALQGFWLEDGQHTVTYEYCPLDVYICLGITVLAYLLGVAYLIWDRRKTC
ncbi:MAG: YfhO family protein [Eubacteriales bacterium]|nr:YfhO family protein [Eubacteriales bacterium]